MAQQKTFGRKNAGAPAPVRYNRAPAPQPVAVAETATASVEINARPADPLDAELAEWKAQRSRGLAGIPWRQLSLMASLCFGIASFVLPDSVNSWVDWALYMLSAASLIVWFQGRKVQKA